MYDNCLNVLNHKKIALLGIGISTLSAYEFLKERNFNVSIWDDNENARKKYQSKLNIVNFTEWDFSSLDAIVISPGISLFYPKEHSILEYIKLYKVPLLSDIELFYYFFPNYNYIGITGSNGKSSIVTLLEKIFKLAGKNVNLAGNIGIPIFTLKNLPENNYIILELSSFQLSFMKNLRLKIAALINIFPNHNTYHGGYLNYKKAKLNIFNNQTIHDYALINIDNIENKILNQHSNISSKILRLSLHKNKLSDFFFKEGILYQLNKSNNDHNVVSFPQLIYDFNKEFNTKSDSFLQMVIFCYVISFLENIKLKVFLQALKDFKGLPHRQEIVVAHNNILFINDSKATTPAASAVALASYNNIYWLVGGLRKSGNLKICAPYFSKIKQVFIFGIHKNKFAKELKGKVPFSCYNTLKEAIIAVYRQVNNEKDNKNKAVVLLSPIGVSFDEFKNFEERGNFFKNTIKELINATI